MGAGITPRDHCEEPMPSVDNLSQAERDEMVGRLKKIEGQARGIQRMFDDGRDCLDVINQVAAVRAAVNALNGELLEAFALRCLLHPEDFDAPQEAVGQAVRAMVRGTR